MSGFACTRYRTCLQSQPPSIGYPCVVLTRRLYHCAKLDSVRVLGVAILSVIAACYSPSYRDCEITCASGSCPGGFVCDQGVCRVEGFSGACGATPEDGGTDAADPNDVDG